MVILSSTYLRLILCQWTFFNWQYDSVSQNKMILMPMTLSDSDLYDNDPYSYYNNQHHCVRTRTNSDTWYLWWIQPLIILHFAQQAVEVGQSYLIGIFKAISLSITACKWVPVTGSGAIPPSYEIANNMVSMESLSYDSVTSWSWSLIHWHVILTRVSHNDYAIYRNSTLL